MAEISLGSTVGMDIGSLLGDSAVGPVVWWGSWYPFEVHHDNPGLPRVVLACEACFTLRVFAPLLAMQKPETKDSASPVKTEASRTQSFARNATSPASSTADKGKKGFKGSKIPKLQFSTMMYHRIWRGSSDCWRLLASLAAILDNRLWHARDREAVLELEDLLFKSSGAWLHHFCLYLLCRPASAWPWACP